MYARIIDLNAVLKRKSTFLFGPRQTGKSTWLRKQFPEALYINLLSKKVYDAYSGGSSALESDLVIFHRKNNSNLIVIDEVQKLPAILDEVHNQIELHPELRFILTGSSARKLKREGVNLLGGRASWRNLFPLVYPELKEKLATIADLEHRLLCGGLPKIFDSEAPLEDLDDYIQLYLTEEIRAEGFVRNYDGFGRFLKISALANATQINFTKVGNHAQVPPRTVHDYFQILEDTLVGFLLPALTQTNLRKAMTSAKFYLFDTGVTNALLGRTSLSARTPEFGALFEQFIILEIKAFVSYFEQKITLNYWRTTTGFEVDLVATTSDNQKVAIEIKASSHIVTQDCSGLLALSDEFPEIKKILVALEGTHRIDKNGVEIIPVFQFLEMLWNREIM